MLDVKPHPRWLPDNGSERHPQTMEEWDYRTDPVGHALDRSLHRLNVAGDYDDPRAPDQMALVLRIDLLRLIGDHTHKHAAWEAWRHNRDRKTALEDAAKVADQFGVTVAPPNDGATPPSGLWRLARDIADGIRALKGAA